MNYISSYPFTTLLPIMAGKQPLKSGHELKPIYFIIEATLGSEQLPVSEHCTKSKAVYDASKEASVQSTASSTCAWFFCQS